MFPFKMLSPVHPWKAPLGPHSPACQTNHLGRLPGLQTGGRADWTGLDWHLRTDKETRLPNLGTLGRYLCTVYQYA